MICRTWSLTFAAVGIGLTFTQHGIAQQRSGLHLRGPSSSSRNTTRAAKTPIEAFRTLSPGEQRKVLDGLPAGKRQKLEQRLRKFNQLPVEQQQTLTTLYNRLHELPTEREEVVRKAVDRFSKQPPARQQAIRDELRALSELSEQERNERIKSADFRSKFSRREQGMIREMSPLVMPE